MGRFLISEDEKKQILKMYGLVNEQETKFLEDNYVSPLIKDGYKLVDKISLPNGGYKKQGGGYRVDLYDNDGKTFTGYVIVTNSGIRGAWNNEPVNVTNGTIEDAYKIVFKDSGYKGPSGNSNQGQDQSKPIANYTTSNFQQLSQEIIDAPGPKTNVQKGKGSFTLKNGNYYTYDFSNVTDYTSDGVSIVFFLSERAENNAFNVENIKPGTIWVGFMNKSSKLATIIYLDSKNQVMVAKDKQKAPPPQTPQQ